MDATLDLDLALPSATAPSPTARARWTGRILSGLAVAFLLFDGGIKLAQLPIVAESGAQLGLPAHINLGIGVLELACLALYLIPRTAILGAVLLTGFLGGAVAIHVRIEDPLLSHVLFPVYVGALLWTGSFLRDSRVRALLGGGR